MNKSELIEALAPRLGGRAQAATAVEAVVDVILREVAAGRSVAITGFGTFERVDRAPRTGRNPRTGEPVPIEGTSSPRFRPGAYFKDVVADPSALPDQGLAGARVGSDGRVERAGAPSSVRRSAGTDPTGDGRRRGPGGAQEDGQPPGRRRARVVSGTPESVRKDAEVVDDARAAPGRTETPLPQTGRIMAGGEDITMGMISAKKAQLARVKDDELAARRQRQAAEDQEKGTTSTKSKKGKKAKKGKKDSEAKKARKRAKKQA